MESINEVVLSSAIDSTETEMLNCASIGIGIDALADEYGLYCEFVDDCFAWFGVGGPA